MGVRSSKRSSCGPGFPFKSCQLSVVSSDCGPQLSLILSTQQRGKPCKCVCNCHRWCSAKLEPPGQPSCSKETLSTANVRWHRRMLWVGRFPFFGKWSWGYVTIMWNHAAVTESWICWLIVNSWQTEKPEMQLLYCTFSSLMPLVNWLPNWQNRYWCLK